MNKILVKSNPNTNKYFTEQACMEGAMKILKKVLSFVLISILFLYNIKDIAYARTDIPAENSVKVGVFLNDFSNIFMSDFIKSLEELQKANKNKIEFVFFDSLASQSTENENIAEQINKHFDLFVVNPVSSNEDEITDGLNQIIQAKIPLIVYLPTTSSVVHIVRSYPNSVIITGNTEQAGTLEGRILADAWNSNKKSFNRQNNDPMRYIMLQGPSNNILTLGRSKYPILALNDAGIKTEQLFSTICNWQRDCARSAVETIFLSLGNNIEAIISNNDSMAIGAIEALQEYGFNTGDSSKHILVVGIGGVSEAKELVDKGIMTGTVVQDSTLHAKAIYDVGMNLISGNPPVNNTNYKLDETGVTIKIPYYEYKKEK